MALHLASRLSGIIFGILSPTVFGYTNSLYLELLHEIWDASSNQALQREQVPCVMVSTLQERCGERVCLDLGRAIL